MAKEGMMNRVSFVKGSQKSPISKNGFKPANPLMNPTNGEGLAKGTTGMMRNKATGSKR